MPPWKSCRGDDMAYFVFVFAAIFLVVFGEITRKKSFQRLLIKRSCDKEYVYPGEEFKLTTTVENNKWLPISFLYIEEEMPVEIVRATQESYEFRTNHNYYLSSYSISWHERIKRSYKAVINRRGVYCIRNMHVSVGDLLGFSYTTQPWEDFLEIAVFPEVKDFKTLKLENRSLQGESIIRRWLFKDMQYIKGIREYNVEDRMKDIHWKSSLKSGKLMVKDYDYTSDQELIIIINVQCGEPYWSCINKSAVERSIDVGVSFAAQAISEGIPVGMWTNAQIVSYNSEFNREVKPSVRSFGSILRLCSRIDYSCKYTLEDYLSFNRSKFNKRAIYVLVTPYLNKESVNLMAKLTRSGHAIKLVDTSETSDLIQIPGVEKINYKGEVNR
jgi:uncharacterized protein (DUF58 family)